MKYVITNAIIHTGHELLSNHYVVVDDGVISGITSKIPPGYELINLRDMHLSAGFIDIQVNGGEKFFFSEKPSEESIGDVHASSLNYGTTHMLPCLISSPREHILSTIETVKNYRNKHNNGVIGFHLEGPFINPVRRGAHVLQYIRKPDTGELREIIQHGKDVIKLMTIAPECFTDEQLEMLINSGIIVSAGHSDLTYQQAQHYFSMGIKIVTHLFNAMSQFGHREPGLVGAALENDNVYAPVIMDGGHCHYASARIAYAMKRDKFLLLSDAAFLGRKRKQFVWNEFDATLVDGYYRTRDGKLAGAAISQAEAIKNAVTELKVSLDEAVKMATIRVAAALNLSSCLGQIAKGYPATFAVFDNAMNEVKSLVLR